MFSFSRLKKTAVTAATFGMAIFSLTSFAVTPHEVSVLFKVSSKVDFEKVISTLTEKFPAIKIEAIVGDVYVAKEVATTFTDEEFAFAVKRIKGIHSVQLNRLAYPPISVPALPSSDKATEIDKKWFITKMQVPLFWEKSKGSHSTKVLICDTGIDANHPDLKGNIGVGMNFIDGSTNTMPTGNPHGTRLAGLIGGQGGRTGAGVTGINWDVQIIPGKITNQPNGGADHAVSAKCIKWGADQGIKVVNLSYSNAVSNLAVQEAADYLYAKGGVLIVSGGNSGAQIDLPDHPHMIAVGGTNLYDWHPPAYNTGNYIDISAPASSLYTTDVGGKYLYDNGSSLAAAVVSGAAALILSARPNLTAEELTKVLLTSTVDLGTAGRDPAFGIGRIDLGKAVSILGL